MNGLLEVLETEYSVENIILPGKQPDVKNYQSICALAEWKNIPIVYMKEGDCIRSGEDTISCLLPDGEYQAEDENGKSMILLYQTKYISWDIYRRCRRSRRKLALRKAAVVESRFS